ncbi:UPF0489 family protein [Collimonas sp.]|jgi:hypothetical protein|uniref:UPF0489 family protein n=1 Tax=Collimonas sp. TaxID=1963772 RepID=UPI002BD5C8EB|nr:UPF0489 family protein [Collimonas sp.]HWW04168.1 UPF0489 family protein [Collimonas sp.]
MHILDSTFFEALRPGESYIERLHDRLWLMDNHKWAYWVWEKHPRIAGQRYGLLHFDYHFDDVNDFFQKPDEITSLRSAGLNAIRRRIEESDGIRYDSFIAPTLLRGIIDHVHFFCKQESDEAERGFDSDTLEECNAQQSFYSNVGEAARADVSKPYFFDLCLDLFNRDDDMMWKGTVWDEDEIRAALATWRELIKGAEIVTVSLSFGYSGTEQQTRQLANIVLPTLLKILA